VLRRGQARGRPRVGLLLGAYALAMSTYHRKIA
jgi:hypothetical protein